MDIATTIPQVVLLRSFLRAHSRTRGNRPVSPKHFAPLTGQTGECTGLLHVTAGSHPHAFYEFGNDTHPFCDCNGSLSLRLKCLEPDFSQNLPSDKRVMTHWKRKNSTRITHLYFAIGSETPGAFLVHMSRN